MKKFMGLGLIIIIVIAVFALSGSLLSEGEHEDGHGHGTPHQDRPESERQSPVELNPALGSEIGLVYEAFLSPHQESGEEEDTPGYIPPQFRSTTPSVSREERGSSGHSVIEFTNDLSRAYIYLQIDGVNVSEINMMHLHCGRPAELGPIIVDFSLAGNIQTYLEDNMMVIEITNEDVEAVISDIRGPIEAYTLGCPISDFNDEHVKTIAGLEALTRAGNIYFNLHTTGQSYFGNMRGQFYPVRSR